MALEVKHLKTSEKGDGQDPSLIQPSDWNADHKITIPAKSLMGRSLSSEGDAEPITVDGLVLEGGVLSNPLAGLEGVDTLIGTALTDPDLAPNARVVTNTATVSWDKTVDKQIKANIVSEGITLDHMQKGTRGQILHYTAAGEPARLAPGTAGQVLVSGGANADVSWSNAGGAPHAVLHHKVAEGGSSGGNVTAATWHTRLLNNEAWDTLNIVVVANNQFTLLAGTYVVEWTAPAFRVNQNQTRLRNISDSTTVASGSASYSETETPGSSQAWSPGIARFTIAASKTFEIQHRFSQSRTSAQSPFGISVSMGEEVVFTTIKIWKVA